jgi:uncharacterized protein (TIGR00369 family)
MNTADSAGSDGMLPRVQEIFARIPFNQVLGLEIRTLGRERPQVVFRMRDDLIGNYVRGTLHGGVISAVIDMTGGLTAFLGLQQNLADDPGHEKLDQFERLGTIDLRVDFLRPGRGAEFVATGHNLRTGRRIAVARVEVANESGELIAVGTGAYVIS